MIKCVIIDDEKLARDSLELLLTRYFSENIKVLSKFGSLKEGVLGIYKHHPDIVFLDIEMPEENGFLLNKIASIMYCEADQNYTRVFTIEGEKILVSKPIKDVQKLLPDNIFFRIHKSHLVNLNYIKSYSRIDGFQVELENGCLLDVATRRKEDFIRALTHR